MRDLASQETLTFKNAAVSFDVRKDAIAVGGFCDGDLPSRVWAVMIVLRACTW
jgi:hypothetical protein